MIPNIDCFDRLRYVGTFINICLSSMARCYSHFDTSSFGYLGLSFWQLHYIPTVCVLFYSVDQQLSSYSPEIIYINWIHFLLDNFPL